MFGLIKKVFGTANDREIKRLALRVDAVNALEPAIRKLSDARLSAKTPEFIERLEKGEELESMIHEAFAVVREAGARVLGQRHFDVQLMGGLVLHNGKIAEMKTGEGKTLAATLAVYANALTGKGVHVVTVNDYLAKRDAAWMGQIYSFLGLTVGTIVHGLNDQQRREAYASHITYGTNNEFGFDYLRDNMKFRAEEFVQREYNFAIVDEVDSILIDEARTPLIISGPAEESTEQYARVDKLIPRLKLDVDFTVDEKARSSNLTEEGAAKAESFLGIKNLFDSSNLEALHHINQALRAHILFKRDTDYIVKNGQVVIVDEFTGRLMPGRRFGDGLHQALEAKEKVKIENENQTLATITFQNYFRMYKKLAGMTGTAETEAAEFAKIYNLDVVVIPTHRRMIRKDHPDAVFLTAKEKYASVVETIEELHEKGQPVLVGTISINNSELVSNMLKTRGVPHQVLNAKHHEQEAQIVAQAGQPGTVTISTNMAGRGTDIVLGQGVPQMGGLFILGTERHESRRIDNQLRGRSGRQGDKGESRFFLSLEDELLRIFGGDRFTNILGRLGMGDGTSLDSPLISRGIENAQKQVENRNFEVRKHLLEYDNVMNRQREVIYGQRKHIITADSLKDDLMNILDEESQVIVLKHISPHRDVQDWDWDAVVNECKRVFNFTPDKDELAQLEGDDRFDYFFDRGSKHLNAQIALMGDKANLLLRYVFLNCLDAQWKDHLVQMDRLKESVGLRGYAQKDPLREYQREGFELFEEMVARIRSVTLAGVAHLRIVIEMKTEDGAADPFSKPQPRRNIVETKLTYQHPGADEQNNQLDAGKIERKSAPRNQQPQAVKTERRNEAKVGRNDPCPCGSGKKYKHCHGA
ncbi:MAG: preprotein translocase subunit SecA [Deltaproteobacteria bacterium]|nr:preprotein translocase subunit SecA [Deltaproteobacteria bacterium]